MHARRSLCCFTLAMLAGSFATTAQAQESGRRNVEQTSFARNDARAKSVTFGRHTPAVGDEVEQTVSVEMRLSTSLRSGNKLAEKATTTMRNEQKRTLTTLDVTDARPTAVLVRYDRASTQLQKTSDHETLRPDAAHTAAPVAEPVQGKSYHCRREADPPGRLVVTDANGNIPPMNEYEIVARNMETIGQPNPFVEFLAGRSVRVGDTISLPKEVAQRLFGMGNDFGDVLRFELTLQAVQVENGVRCAVFHAVVDASSNDSSQMRLQVEGPLVVEIDSCRAVRTELSGPIGISETRGSYSTAQQLIGTGRLAVAITSTYRDAE